MNSGFNEASGMIHWSLVDTWAYLRHWFIDFRKFVNISINFLLVFKFWCGNADFYLNFGEIWIFQIFVWISNWTFWSHKRKWTVIDCIEVDSHAYWINNKLNYNTNQNLWNFLNKIFSFLFDFSLIYSLITTKKIIIFIFL